MPVPKSAALAVAACAVASAITSCSGNLATSTTADAGADMDAGSIGEAPESALRQVSLAMTRVNFGDSPTADAWKQIGFNLDGKFTIATSTDVCQLVPGANPAAQDDGQEGIDNSFGENVCAILDSVGVSCSTDIPETYVVTDSSGSGTLTIQFAEVPTFRWDIPIKDAHVVLNGDGSGMLGAVTPTTGMINAFVEAVGGIDCGQHNGQPQSILLQLEQASDILSDGSNSAGQQCDAISIGMQFWDATPFDGVLPAPDACPTD